MTVFLEHPCILALSFDFVGNQHTNTFSKSCDKLGEVEAF